MDSKLFDMIHDEMPKFNPAIVEGWAMEQVPQSEAYIDQIFSSVSKAFPAGLKYEGYSRCTPQEEYNEITNKRGTKRFCEISRSDIYLVKYKFSFKGKPLFQRYIYLPFVTDGGLISIRGSHYMISPVLADPILSVEHNNIFIVLNCAKLKFERVVHHFIANQGMETVNVVWAPVHNEYRKRSGINKPCIDACTTLVHYLFCKFGAINTFKQFTDTDIVIGQDDITADKYKPDKWVICSSSGFKPAKLKDKFYTQTPIRIAIPVKKYNQVNRSLLGAFFYVLDHFPDRFTSEMFSKENENDEKNLWKILLGHLIFSSGSNEGDLNNKIDEHLNSLSDYIDEMDKMSLEKGGISSADIYSLFFYVIVHMPDLLLNIGSSVASMYRKQLSVLRYLLSDIRFSISRVKFKLNKANGKRPLTEDDINKILNRELSRDTITGINKNRNEITSISSPGDNKIFKITSNVVMQTKSGSNNKKKGRANIADPSKHLHVSNAEVGSIVYLPQSDPTGRSRINPFIQIGHDGSIIRNEKFVPLLDEIQEMISR